MRELWERAETATVRNVLGRTQRLTQTRLHDRHGQSAPEGEARASPRPPLRPWRHRVAASGALAVAVSPLLIAGYPAPCAGFSDICALS